jgi:hypothetical protein
MVPKARSANAPELLLCRKARIADGPADADSGASFAIAVTAGAVITGLGSRLLEGVESEVVGGMGVEVGSVIV